MPDDKTTTGVIARDSIRSKREQEVERASLKTWIESNSTNLQNSLDYGTDTKANSSVSEFGSNRIFRELMSQVASELNARFSLSELRVNAIGDAYRSTIESKWSKVLTELDKLCEYKDDWDDNGALGMTKEMHLAALIHLVKIKTENIAFIPTGIGLTTAGFVRLEWRFGDEIVCHEINELGRIHQSVFNKTTQEYTEAELTYTY
jgi:hypothetical protein